MCEAGSVADDDELFGRHGNGYLMSPLVDQRTCEVDSGTHDLGDLDFFVAQVDCSQSDPGDIKQVLNEPESGLFSALAYRSPDRPMTCS